MFRKTLVLIFSIILVSSLVGAASRDKIFDFKLKNPYVYENKEFPLALKIFNQSKAPVFGVTNGIITSKDSQTNIQGLILTSSNFRNSNGENVNQKILANGDFSVKRKTIKLGSQTGPELMTQLTFTTETGLIKIGNYLLKCEKNCKLSFGVLGNEMSVKLPWINIEGTAELSKPNDPNFEKISLTDLKFVRLWEELYDVNDDKKLDNVLRLRGIGLKKTSAFKNINLQTQKPVIFSSLNKGETIVSIFNPITLRKIPANNTKFYVNDDNKAKINLWLNKKKILTLYSGVTIFTDNFQNYWNCAIDSQYGCILVDESSVRVQPLTVNSIKMKTIIYPNSKKEIIFAKIGLTDLSSSYISKRNKKLEFTFNSVKQIPKKVNIFSFKTDFTAQLYSEKDSLYHEYKCLWKEKKCFYDDKQVSQGFTNLRPCFDDEDCLEGEFCSKDPNCKKEDEDLCAKKRCLKETTCEETGNSPGRILFIADGYALTPNGEQEFKRDVNDLLNNGLYTFEPFNSFEAKAAFSPIYMQVGSLPSRFDGAPLIDLAQNYRDKCESQISKKIPYTVVISKGGKAYRAFAHLSRNVLVMPVSSGTITLEDKRLFTHEFGHLFADLADEYVGFSKYFRPPYHSFPNCASSQVEAESWLKDMGLNAEAYGNFQYKGCGGDCPSVICSGYIKPSEDSIMANYKTGGFNEPSKWAIKNKLRELTGLGGIL